VRTAVAKVTLMQRLAKVSNRYLVWPLETICFMVLLCSKVSFSTHKQLLRKLKDDPVRVLYSCVGTFFAYLCEK
jgi:hypothetical protein